MIDNKALAQTRTRIKAELSQLASMHKRGDDGQLLVWVIPEGLACAHRPLRYHHEFGGSGKLLPPEAAPDVHKWVGRILGEGIQAIICLMHATEVDLYAAIDHGAPDILGLYRKRGLLVCHLPWEDPAHPSSETPISFKRELLRIRKHALECFGCLPKPVLIHCSAGQDRSAPVAAFIDEVLRGKIQ